MEYENDLSLDLLQNEVDDVVSGCAKDQLAQCARLLATYVALYKHEFGELSQDRFAVLSQKLADNVEFGEAVYSTGLKELLETLAVVDTQAPEANRVMPEVRTIN